MIDLSGSNFGVDQTTISIIAVIISIISLYFTIRKNLYDKTNSIRPALVFVYTSEFGWQIQNIGAGSAFNVLVMNTKNTPEWSLQEWENPVRVPPMKKDGIFNIHWNARSNAHGFGAMYDDISGRRYTTICGRDLNEIKRGYKLGKWSEKLISKEWLLHDKDILAEESIKRRTRGSINADEK